MLIHINRFRTSWRCGFSSVEFLGASVIILILTTFSMVGYRLYERELPVKHTAQRLMHAFSTARSFAIGNNSNYAVRLDTQLGIFWIDETDGEGATVVPKVVRPEPIDEQVAVEGFFFGASEASLDETVSVQFFPDGSGEDVSVWLRMQREDGTDDRDIYTVRVYGPTGQTRLFERERIQASLMPLP